MRAIILSDTHGSRNKLCETVAALGDFDVLVHLGDGASDLDAVRPYINADIIAVQGNNDIFTNLPEWRAIELCGQKVYCCHGHNAGVRGKRDTLARLAREAGCSLAFYGHTHSQADETIDGVRCMNPGSIGYPVGGRAVIEMTDDGGETNIRFITGL